MHYDCMTINLPSDILSWTALMFGRNTECVTVFIHIPLLSFSACIFPQMMSADHTNYTLQTINIEVDESGKKATKIVYVDKK